MACQGPAYRALVEVEDKVEGNGIDHPIGTEHALAIAGGHEVSPRDVAFEIVLSQVRGDDPFTPGLTGSRTRE
jgi:hypothetical protein